MLRYSTVLMVQCTINDTHSMIFAASGLYILDMFEWGTTPCNPHHIENDAQASNQGVRGVRKNPHFGWLVV